MRSATVMVAFIVVAVNALIRDITRGIAPPDWRPHEAYSQMAAITAAVCQHLRYHHQEPRGRLRGLWHHSLSGAPVHGRGAKNFLMVAAWIERTRVSRGRMAHTPADAYLSDPRFDWFTFGETPFERRRWRGSSVSYPRRTCSIGSRSDADCLPEPRRDVASLTAMQEIDLETLRFPPRGRATHFVRDYEAGKSAEGDYAVTFCGRWAHESHVIRQKYSAVQPFEWCAPCYLSRRKAIDREFGVTTR